MTQVPSTQYAIQIFGKAAFVGRDVKDAPRVGKNDRTGARNGRAVHSVAA